jgi:transcriptional regulator with XRE-family HTH domain
MIYKMATRRVELGLTGDTVRTNLKRIRDGQRLRLEDVAVLMTAAGRPMTKAILSQIETGGRRVDVDDLMTLAFVLKVNPNALLLPPAAPDGQRYAVQVPGFGWIDGALVQDWAEGRQQIDQLVPPASDRNTYEQWQAWNEVEWHRLVHPQVDGDVPNRRTGAKNG